MPNTELSRGTLFPPELVTDLIDKTQGKSVLAALSAQRPIMFNGQREFIFSMDSEIDVVAENGAKSHGGIDLTPVNIVPIKVEYGARISDEFMYGSEEEKIDVLKNFNEGFAKKLAKGIDLMAIHGINPRSNSASAVIGTNNFDSVVNQRVTYTAADPDQLTKDNGVWKTGWYFENDAAFYHFRAVGKNAAIVNDTDGDYFNMSSGTTDYHWGAPMNEKATMEYNQTTGYASSISDAIRATTSTINLTELHMMSNIHIVLRTTTGNDAVVLYDESKNQKCEVKLTDFYAAGKVNLGNGLVTVTSSILTANQAFTEPTDYSTEAEASNTHVKLKTPFTLYVVPQYVKRSSDAIGLTITTPDGNVYTIKDLSASTSTTFWEPNHQYTYTFTLTKAGVAVTCKVQNWVLVTAGDTDISLES